MRPQRALSPSICVSASININKIWGAKQVDGDTCWMVAVAVRISLQRPDAWPRGQRENQA
jgi:hypothetical protein